MPTLLCHVPVQICHVSSSKLLNKCRGQSYVYFNTNIASARSGYQSRPRSTSGNEEMPFSNKDTEHRAKKQTKLPFTQWSLNPQLLHCGMTQMGRKCPLGIAWWSGTLLSSKRCRLELSHAYLHITLLDKCYVTKVSSSWIWRDASILTIFYKKRALQK